MIERKYRFAFDIGTNSIGFAVFEVDSIDKDKIVNFITCGSRIFSDSRDEKTKASLAVARREARQKRRRCDRITRRRRLLLSHLVEYGLFPSDKTEQEALKDKDPYLLRTKLLKERCTLFELGRAILHLNKRRGFKSSRKDDKTKGGKLAKGIHQLRSVLQGKTLGEYFNDIKQGKTTLSSIKCRPSSHDADSYDFYIDRSMVEEEFKLIWDFQKQFYPEVLTEERYQRLHKDIFYQRPLLPQEIGKCRFEAGESRVPATLPTFELYRLYCDLAHLRITTQQYTERSLTPQERDDLIEICKTKKSISFTSLRSAIKLDSEYTFRHSSFKGDEKKNTLMCCPTIAEIYKVLAKTCYKELSLENMDTLAYLIMDCADADILIALLTKQRQLPNDIELMKTVDEEIQEILNAFSIFNDKYQKNKAPITAKDINALPQFTDEDARKLSELQIKDAKYGSLSLKAIRKILPYLQEPQEIVQNDIHLHTYNQACSLAGYVHSDTTTAKKKEEVQDSSTGEVRNITRLYPNLPYYGRVLPESVMGEWKGERAGAQYAHLTNRERYGFIANPTVHVALNQLRIVVNALIKEYGHPENIVIELARDIAMGAKEKGQYITKQSENTVENKINDELIKQYTGREYASRDDRERMKLFKEAQSTIGNPVVCIYSGKTISLEKLFTREIEVDHIINHADSKDDSFSNKILCFSRENQMKGNRTPYEAFHTDKEKWNDIIERVKKLPKNKQWRFQQDARQRFEEKYTRSARDLGDTRYIARIAKKYLEAICNDIHPVTGSHTHFLAKQWGFLKAFTEENYTPSAFTTVISNVKKESKKHNDNNNDYERIRGELLESKKAEQVYADVNDTIEKKNRLNHFHHAIDACLLGCMTGSMRKYFSEVGKKAEELTNKLVAELKKNNIELTEGQQEQIRFIIKNNTKDTLKEECLQGLSEEIHTRIEELRDSLHKRFAPPIPNLLEQIKDVLSRQVVSHKVDHNTLGQLHKETNYGRVEHSLRFQDFKLADLRLISYKPLLEHIVLELGYAYGIPCDTHDSAKICAIIHNSTEKKAESELIKFLKINKELTVTERDKQFIIAFTRICKDASTQDLLREAWIAYGNEKYAKREVIRKIPCIYDEERFVGNVVARIAVKDMRIEDLPYIKEKELLARILQKLIGYSIEEAMRYAKELHKMKTREKKARIQKIVNYMEEKQFQEAFMQICQALQIRRIQCVDTKNNLIWIQDKKGKEYKGVDGRNNAYMTIYIDSSGKWCGECISAYNANQSNFIPEWKKNSDNIHVIDIYKGDAIEIDVDDIDGKKKGKEDKVSIDEQIDENNSNVDKKRAIFIVQKINNAQGMIYLYYHKEANVAAREKELNQKGLYKRVAISPFQKLNPKFVHINPLGRIIYKSGIRYAR